MGERQEMGARVEALERIVAEQAATIDELRRALTTRPARSEAAESTDATDATVVDRRHLLSNLGKVAAGALVGGAAAAVVAGEPVAAVTTKFSDTGGLAALHGESTSTGNTGAGLGVLGTASGVASTIGVAAQTPAVGVFGAGPVGVTGFAVGGAAADQQGVVGQGLSTGRGGVFSGGRADLQIGSGAGVSGPSRTNASGGHTVGELAMQSNGDLWLCVASTANNVAGSWRRVALVDGPAGTFTALPSASGKPGVKAQTDDQTSAAQAAVDATSTFFLAPAVKAANTSSGSAIIAATANAGQTGLATVQSTNQCPTGIGVRGVVDNSNAFGVVGLAQGTTSIGVLGTATQAGSIGVKGTGSTAGVGVEATGASADLRLVAGAAGPSRDHAAGHSVGELAMEATGALWICVGAGAPGQPGTWKRLAYVEDLPPAFDSGALSGVFTALTKPGRVYDSRVSGGKLSAGQSRVISVATTLEGAEIVPAGASAAVFTITLDQTEGAGFLSVFPSNVIFQGTSSINWFATGQVFANGGTVTVPADRTVTVLAGGAGATHFIIDIAGVYT